MKNKIQESLMGLVAALYFVAIAFDLILPDESERFYSTITNEQLVLLHVGPLALVVLVFFAWELVERIYKQIFNRMNPRLDTTRDSQH